MRCAETIEKVNPKPGEDVEIEILSKGSKGFLGLGASEAKVKVKN